MSNSHNASNCFEYNQLFFGKYQGENFTNCHFRPLHQYHQEFVERVGCSAKDQPGDMKKLIDCLETKSLNEIYAHAFMFDECNIVIPGFGGHSNNNIVLNNYLILRAILAQLFYVYVLIIF